MVYRLSAAYVVGMTYVWWNWQMPCSVWHACEVFRCQDRIQNQSICTIILATWGDWGPLMSSLGWVIGMDSLLCLFSVHRVDWTSFFWWLLVEGTMTMSLMSRSSARFHLHAKTSSHDNHTLQFRRDNTICGDLELFGLITCNEIRGVNYRQMVSDVTHKDLVPVRWNDVRWGQLSSHCGVW